MSEAEIIRDLLRFIRSAPVSSGTCCCGTQMNQHCSSSDHVPIDMWEHSSDLYLKKYISYLNTKD
jgi:hypothetical protein